MTDPIVVCPNCKTTIHVTESLAAPLIEVTKQEYEKKIGEITQSISTREKELKEKEKKQ